MRTRSIFNGLNLHLGSQLICIVDFEFPTMGSPLLGDPIAHSSDHELLPFSFRRLLSLLLMLSLFTLCFLSRIANHLPSHSILLFIA